MGFSTKLPLAFSGFDSPQEANKNKLLNNKNLCFMLFKI
jgi:hypothetical protein